MFTDYTISTTYMFFNLDEVCLEQWGDAKYYEANVDAMTAVTNYCRGLFTAQYPGSVIDSTETYVNEYDQTMLKATCLQRNRN